MEPPGEYPRPSLKEIRGNGEKDRNLWWVRTDSGSITHTERWEKVWNPEWKLRIEQSVIDYLYKRKTGPKSRYSRKGVGRKPGGRAHQIRRASLFLLMHQDGEWWKERLTESDSSRHMKSAYSRIGFLASCTCCSSAVICLAGASIVEECRECLIIIIDIRCGLKISGPQRRP